MRKNTSAVVAWAVLAGVVMGATAWGADPLADGFKSPPASARPWTWWHWVSGNISKEGITADLEAMKRIGLAGAQAFSVDQGPRAQKPVLYMTPEWRDMMHHAISEANRLGLQLAMHDCEGWSESGGLGTKPENSMQKVVWSEQRVHGGGHVDLQLSQPETIRDYYRDIAVLAFPAVAGDDLKLAQLKPRVSSSGGENEDLAKLTDGNQKTAVTIAPEKQGGAAWVQFDFDHPVRCGSANLMGVSGKTHGDVQVSEDGKNFRTVGSFSASSRRRASELVTFDVAPVRAIRLSVDKPDAKGWSLSEVEAGGERVPDYVARSGMAVNVHPAPMPASVPADAVVKRDGIVDLSAHLSGDGHLSWDAPAGEWTVLRLGTTTTGITNHPAMEETRGLECDKLNRKAVQNQFNATVAKVADDAGKLAGNGLNYVLMDSWEAGCQNWTADFREEFQHLRGYDPQPWMAALTGRYVGSPEQTERFLWDYRRTIADLLADNHYGLFRDLSHQANLKLTAEAVGIGMPTIADELQCKGRTDVPMGEFWVDRKDQTGDTKEAASGAHIYGQNIAAAESFTAVPQAAGWRNDPQSLKALGDAEFCLGINRFVFHRYAAQPYLDRVPGVTMGPWGINFERTNTWWEPGRAWIDYISRCQYLLQRGTFVADVAYFYGEGAPVNLRPNELKPELPAGYDYDAVNAEVLLTKMQVRDGRLVLPTGMMYRVLVLPETPDMTPAVAKKVKELVNAGATVVGPRPERSPSLSGYPQCDQQVAAIGRDVWGDCDGKSVTEHRYGRGRVVWGRKLADVLSPVWPDFQAPAADVKYIHRRDGGADIYFVSNQQEHSRVIDCTFRVDGKAPELWWPDTGRIQPMPIYKQQGGRTTLPIRLDPVGSVFVVFRNPAGAAPVAAIEHQGRSLLADAAAPGAPSGNLVIRKAEYGVLEGKGKRKDVTSLVAEAAQSGRLQIPAENNALGGDPAVNQVKQLRVEYVYDGKPGSVVVAEGENVAIPADFSIRAALPAGEISSDGKHVLLTAWDGGNYDWTDARGQRHAVSVDLPKSVEVSGPWHIKFQPGRLAPAETTLGKLTSWTESSDPGIKYFSGTAIYEKQIQVPPDMLDHGRRVCLDLGRVKNLAEVTVNGKDIGVLWKAPFRVDVTDALKPGANTLEIRVTNLWPNRLIGDQLLPEDKRVTWTTYNPYKKDSPLLRSGLLGPVTLEPGKVVELK